MEKRIGVSEDETEGQNEEASGTYKRRAALTSTVETQQYASLIVIRNL